MLERLFQLNHRRTTVAVELRAGAVTFLTMAYILAVNPQILAATGMPRRDVLVATALASAAATLVMGLYANFPFALAPGMGLNAYFAFTVVGAMGVSWQMALAAIFVEGVLFLALSLAGIRSRMLDAVPRSLKLATMSGIGFFLAFIGLRNAGLVAADEATLVRLGDLHQPAVLLAVGGVLLMVALLARRVPGAVLIAIVGIAGIAWLVRLAPPPEALFSLPRLPRETLLALDFSGLFSLTMVTVVLAFLFVDLLDTAGTLIGVGQLAGFVDEDGRFPGSERAFVADAVGTSVGAVLGTSTVTTYIESATGVEEGGRTGLAAVATAGFFLLSLFLAPVFVAVPAIATAPALIVVGSLMMQGARDLDWTRIDEAVPALLTIGLMPFTYSIANGIAIGILSWVAIKVLIGRAREVGWVMATLAVLLAAFYAFLSPG
jgi:AGZA family xanthine/uracil permease-like MFS transporter